MARSLAPRVGPKKFVIFFFVSLLFKSTESVYILDHNSPRFGLAKNGHAIPVGIARLPLTIICSLSEVHIAALILVLAIGLKYGTGDVCGITFMLGNVNIMLSGLAIAALVAIIMNAILPGKDYEFGANEQGDTSVNFGSRAN